MPNVNKKTGQKDANHRLNQVWKEIVGGGVEILDQAVLTEPDLKAIADRIKRADAFGSVFSMIEQLPRHGRNYDWNVGSIIRYFESKLILDAIDLAGGVDTVRNSMGVAWALGEAEGSNFSCKKTLRFIVERTENHEAWRLAAHSLSSKAGDFTPVDIMLRSLNSIGYFEPLEYCLSDLGDSRSACGVLLHRSSPRASCAVAEAVVRRFYDGCPDYAVLRNCCWLSEQMALQDDNILKGLVDCAKSDDYDLRHAAITAIGSYPDGLGTGILRVLSRSEDDLSRRLATRYLPV